MGISHNKVLRVYNDTCALLSSTKSLIYDKEEQNYAKVIISYKPAKQSNIFIFDPSRKKIHYSRWYQAQFLATYVNIEPQ